MDGLPFQREGGAQHKGVGPFGERFGVGVQLKFQQGFGVVGHRVLYIPGKAVLAARVLHALSNHLAAGQLAGVGEQNGRMAAPDGGVAPPEQFSPGGLVDDADRLRAVGIHSQAKDVVFNAVLHREASL